MPIPHVFPSLLNPDAPRSVLLIGAGMSNGMAPPVHVFTEEIRQRHNKIIQKLGINIHPPTGDQFYDWADDAFNELKNVHHLSNNEAKLRLADAMGVTSDPRFHAKVGMPLRGNTPRHRIAARFAREGRLNSIWSLNWDCILESALESVGLLPHPNPSATLPNPLPWKRWYCTWSPGDQHNPNVQGSTLHIVKPHGCVNRLAIRNATSFIVTKSEIAQLPVQLETIIAGRMNVGFSDAPLITSGWSAEEKYIHEKIEAIKQQGTLIHHGADKLSVINRSWYPKTPTVLPEKHDRVAAAFDVDRTTCHFSVENAGEPKLDELFQWLQTRYGLERMQQYAQANGWISQTQELGNVLNNFPEPQTTDWLNGLFDDFLSVWVRLCFNASCVVYKSNSAPLPQNLIATHRRDEHIPWMYGDTDRNDLLAAIHVVLALRVNLLCPWSFSEYPGALWNGLEGHLVLPLPAWGTQGQPIELAALKPLMDGWNWTNKGAIKKLSILPLLPHPSFLALIDNDTILRSSVAWLTKANQFADPAKIGVVSLSDL